MLRSETYPQLPPLPKLPAKEMAGPTPWSNWVIPGRVIAGAYPASLDDNETEKILTTLLELGINTFVCLQAEVNINTPEHAWRSGHGLRPYIKDAQKILSKAHETSNPKITQQKIDFLHLPIIDGNVTTDAAMNRLAEDCMERILRGEKLYIHCWGGHGRTGTLVSVVLGRLYGISYTNAFKYCQSFHDSRVYPQNVRSPQTPVQRAQVRRLLASQSATPTTTISKLNSLVPTTVGARTPSTPLAALGLGKNASPALQGAAGTALRVPTTENNSRIGAVLTPPSPMRSRPTPVAGLNRFGRSSESPMRVDARPASDSRYGVGNLGVDKLSTDFSRLQGPSSGRGLAATGATYSSAFKGRAQSRGSATVAHLRRQEVNVR
mmetsp:Transcript_28923/g.53137  ORF Transcript_28923/g.53137 Transcript_28923/m.53137 type:complete len:379 (+) Transcript_28923:4364-5500(+)